MKKFIYLVFSLVLFLLSNAVWADHLIARVVGILDGDTIEVLDREAKRYKVRLAQIDAPEKSQPYGQKSKQYLSHLIYKKEVILEWYKKDRYGRLLAIVYVDKKNINYDMVINGFAWAYERYMTDDIYKIAQQNAKRNEKGLWSHPQPIEPWNWRRK